MTTFERTVYQSLGISRVFQVLLVVGEAWAKDAADYWTVDLRITSAAKPLGKVIGSYSLQTRNLVAGTPVTVYSSSVGLAMSDGERLRATVTPTGAPDALTDAVIFAQVQRNARP
jgi:hypothetical protein